MVSKAQQKATHKYIKNNYDRAEIQMPKGKKELVKAYAEKQGLSLNAYINKLIDEDMNQPKE